MVRQIGEETVLLDPKTESVTWASMMSRRGSGKR